ncbi:MAG: AzlC family ABC transporter permease [Actinophytocola sp.]|uniref:AzlC family ABC transporter permease n=1 Tax=Actinophytocola sp. TaxID=1872138 RepID=UPI003C78FF9C
MTRERLAEVGRGARDVVPIILGAVPFGVLFGALAAEANFGLVNSLLMSLLVYSGTMQMIGLNMITIGTSWPLVAFASFIVNSRHAFYSAALTPHMRKLSLWWRLVLSYGMTDQIYVLAEHRYATRDGSTSKHWYMLSTSAALFAVWLASTWTGFAFGDVLKQFEQLGLDFALIATYIALAASSLTDFRAIAAGTSSGLLSVGLFGIPYQGGLFIAIVGGIATGLVAEHFFPRDNSDAHSDEPVRSDDRS